MKKYHGFFLFFCFLLILLPIAFLFTQTEAFQNYLAKILIAKAEAHHVRLILQHPKSEGPLKWSCDEISLYFEDGSSCEFRNAYFRIAFLPLFRGRITLTSIKIDRARIAFSSIDRTTVPFTEIRMPKLPVALAAGTLKVHELTLIEAKQEKELRFELKGRVAADRDLQEIRLDMIMAEPSQNNLLHVRLLSSKKKDLVLGKTDLRLQDASDLAAFFSLSLQSSLEAEVFCRGPWSYWQKVKHKVGKEKLDFTVRMKTDSLTVGRHTVFPGVEELDAKGFLCSDLSSSFDHFSLEGETFQARGNVAFSPDFLPTVGSVTGRLRNIDLFLPGSPFPVSGIFEIEAKLRKETFDFLLSSEKIRIGNETLSPFKAGIESSLFPGGGEGKAFCSSIGSDIPWEFSSDFTFSGSKIHIRDLTLQAKEAKLSGTLDTDTGLSFVKGSFFVMIPELRPFRRFFPDSQLQGKIGGNCTFSYMGDTVSLASKLLGKNIRYRSSVVNTVTVDLEGSDILYEPKGKLSCEFEDLITKQGRVAKLSLVSVPGDKGRQSYELEATGNWKRQFRLESRGSWHRKGSELSLETVKLEGTIFNQTFATKPFRIENNSDRFSLSDFALQIGDGILRTDFFSDPSHAELSLYAEKIPLDALAVLYPNISLLGYTSCQGKLSVDKEHQAQGYFLASLEKGSLPLTEGKGSLQVHFHQNTAQLHTYFHATDHQFLEGSITVPIVANPYPFRIGIRPDASISGDWICQGEIDTIFSFLQVPNQKTEGLLTSRVFVSGTTNRPYLQGEGDIQNGIYENYSLGIRLKNIHADFSASGSDILLNRLYGEGKKGGKFSAEGLLSPDPKNRYPFTMDAKFESLWFLDSDYLKTCLTGDVYVKGDLKQTNVSGNLDIDAGVFLLSDAQKREIPSLPFTYLNKPIRLEQSELPASPDYPINLDLHLTGSETIEIKGRGLQSRWKGDLYLTGTPEQPIGKGTLVLEKGEFTFSGKTFVLTEGKLTFSDKPEPEARLALTGDLHLPAATIIANLQGSLSSPVLTFRSVPPLPTSSILSLVLFNKDISEITPFQALQLAQVVMNLSGNGGPDVMGTLRKTIGVDKLNITGKEGSDEIALQIGWCVAKGITVSLSQSATGSDVTIEVDLKNGFLFEAETQNREEGKFSLKWNHNY